MPELLDAGTPARALVNLAEKAARCTPATCGATATATIMGDPGGRQSAATHPDLSPLVAVQWQSGEGPIPTAIGSGRPTRADDLLYQRGWSEYRARALEAGVRSSATFPCRQSGLDLTVSLYSFRPGLATDNSAWAAELLNDLTAEALASDQRYREAAAEAAQLDNALRSRPVVDQACGILMHMLGCTAEDAFDVLRGMSQRTNRKLSDLAQGVIDTRGRGIEAQVRQFAGTGHSAR